MRARIVGRGFKQLHVEDNYETFALVIRLNTIGTTVVVAIQNRWKLKQLDVKTTIFNEIIEVEVYMGIPYREPKMEKEVAKIK